ncbi:dynamin family protein [Macrococcoides caseolyticum]|uniref:dynamin family protein n=1 Tax=Macrococcoides caseolyticum TaxID=69966 RepID=UPI001F2EAB02|nr:dynamin family protein [Macrococcus caseolyticus]MCE4957036.1 dynamin family protein [Macrococcus caseolyticus]
MKNEAQIRHLYQLKKEVEKSDHFILVEQINEIIKKIHQNHTVISFIGHFSSGKSSLINHIFNENILPSSPVPTTSNTAQIIISKQDSVRINMDNHTYSDLNHYDEIKRVNTLNHKIESVEINKVTDHFEIGTVIQDTPGIDATFKNHEASTMKFLLVSDVVFYTVEYNHVNSEKNFEQIRMLNAMGVPVVLIINQIDKHQDKELSFNAFKTAITENISRWNLNIEHILYTSIFECPHNEINFVMPTMKAYASDAKANKHAYFEHMINYIEAKQIDYLQNKKQNLLMALNIEEDEVDNAYQKATKSAEMNAEQVILTDENNTQLLLNNVKEIIKNAYLMPFEMREMNREMLETFADNYKVPGLFGKKAKLIAIQDAKVNEVVDALNAIIEKQITFQLKAYYSQFSKYLIDARIINDLAFHINYDAVKQRIKQQPSIINDYVLIFSDELKSLIERLILNHQKDWHEQFIKNINMSNLNTNSSVSEETVKFDAYFVNESFIKSITTKNYLHYYIHVDESIDKLIGRTFVNFEVIEECPTAIDKKTKAINMHDATLDRSLNILKRLEHVDYFKTDIENINAQIDRLNQNLTKIVVFGAFSAGKSAMINALLQEEILISSPNPTTASITEIQYGNKNYVTFKLEKDILKSLNDMMFSSAIEITTIPQWIKRFKGKLDQLNAQNRNFAEAIIQNYDRYAAYLNELTTIEVSKSEIKQFTAEDAHAAFVQKITLGVQNDFLKDKMIIDSPGTGSTNSRHTKETTEIIADSDLLIYVSYYNHVYTEKDKAFLSYLNEVEIINEDSQNFFVINAVDLARDEAEMQTVINYLSNELQTINIDDPIYPISSRNALITYDDRFMTFKSAINNYVASTSKQQKIKQINHQTDILLDKAKALVTNFEAYEMHIKHRNAQYDQWLAKGPIEINVVDTVIRTIEDMLNEQTTYLKDKMKIQLYDILKAEFNTSSDLATVNQSYLQAVQHKLNEDLYLIMPRINKGIQIQYNQAVSIVTKALEQNEIYEDIQFKDHYLNPNDLSISQITNQLHQLKLGNIKQKQLMNQSLRTKLYDDIHAITLKELKLLINQYEHEIKQLINDNSIILTEHINKKNNLMHQTMQEKRVQKIDKTIIKHVSEAIQKIEVE